MPEQNQTIEEGAGLYNFSELLGEEIVKEEERELVIPDDPEQEQEEVEEVEAEETPKAEEQEEVEEVEAEETPKAEEQEETKKIPKEEIQKSTNTGNNYSSLAKKYIELGTWKDAEIEIDGESVVLSELEDLDEETFLDIVQAQDAQRSSEIDEKFINKEDLDDISLKIIEISKNGGDIKDVLRAKETYIDNLNTYDLDDEQNQELLVRQMYKIDNPKLSEKQIDNLVNIDKSELELDEKAKKFADNLKQSYHSMLDKKKEEASQAKVAQKESIKTLRKGLKEHLVSFGIKTEAALRPLLDSATKEKDGGYYVDQQFKELKEDPKELAEFLVWKNNREDYNKIISNKETSKAKKDTMIKLNIARGKHQSKKTVEPKKDDLTTELNSRLKFI